MHNACPPEKTRLVLPDRAHIARIQSSMTPRVTLLRNGTVINPVKLVVTFSPRRLKYAVTRCLYVTFPFDDSNPLYHAYKDSGARPFIFLIA